MAAFATAVSEDIQKRSIRGTARALQGARSIAKDATAIAARHDSTRGRLPIGTAAAAGRLIEVEQLLDSGVNVNEQDAFGETALHLACMEGQYKVVRMLVVEQQARVDIKNWEGWVPMIWAIGRGHIQIAKFLSERGSSLQWKSYLGWTPLHFAAIQGDLEIVDWLLEEGADALATGEDGCMPGDCASNAAVRKTLYKTVAHQKLSAGEDQRQVRAFLEGHRMSHILDHDDLHQTLAQLPAPAVQRKSALVATRFAGQLNAASHSARRLSVGNRGSTRRADKAGAARGGRSGRLQAPRTKEACAAAASAHAEAAAAAPPPAAAAIAGAELSPGEGQESSLAGANGAAATGECASGRGTEAAASGVPTVTVSGLLGGVGGEALLGRDGMCDQDGRHTGQAEVVAASGRRSVAGQAVRFTEVLPRDSDAASGVDSRLQDSCGATGSRAGACLISSSGEEEQVSLLTSRVPHNPIDFSEDMHSTRAHQSGQMPSHTGGPAATACKGERSATEAEGHALSDPDAAIIDDFLQCMVVPSHEG